ncbi:MAG: hypothetical protein NZ585_11770 [Chloracidobacterium sp.]|nr:hypothetical protein [Chloracidobacterium sp.]MDW8218253.1 hypothetical protein [Acidobacteriota bacterium]
MRYAAGQVWAYRHRPGEEASRLTILRVDADPQHGWIVHIAVSGVAIKSPHAPDGYLRHIGHLPLTEVALDASVTALVETQPPPPAGDGYATWREAFDGGEGGVFIVPLDQLIDMLEEATS